MDFGRHYKGAGVDQLNRTGWKKSEKNVLYLWTAPVDDDEINETKSSNQYYAKKKKSREG